MPTLGSVLVRLTQLLVLVVLANVAGDTARSALVAGFGIVSAAAVIADSGAANFLLTSRSGRVGRRVMAAVLGIHSAFAVAGGVLAIAICLVSFSESIDALTLWILVSISLTQILDSMTRVARAPALLRGSDSAYAAPDFILTALKVPLLIAAWVSGELMLLLALPLVSAGVFAWTIAQTMRRLEPGGSYPRLFRHVLMFGMAGAASALYSQSPILVGAFFLPVEGLAVLSLVYRVIQPLEILPATASQQLMPRLVRKRYASIPIWASFAATGLVLAIAVVAARPVIEQVFGVPLEPWIVLIVVASALPLKFGNYALSAIVMARGLVRWRLVVTLIVGLVVATAVVVLSATLSVYGAALMTPIGELLLAVGLAAILVRSRRVEV